MYFGNDSVLELAIGLDFKNQEARLRLGAFQAQKQYSRETEHHLASIIQH